MTTTRRPKFLSEAVLAVLLGVATAVAQDCAAPWLRAVATAGALRACGRFFPDPDRVESCLHRQEARTGALAAVLQQHAAPAGSTRGVQLSDARASEPIN
jgi:hypothetical protein